MEENVSPDKQLRDLLFFHVKKKLTYQSKAFLVILEDLLARGYTFDYAAQRKIILDLLGSSTRELQELMDKFEIKLKS